MKFRSNRKNIIIGIVLLLIVTISIGYAALSSNLTIKGNSGIKDNRWLIYFDNIVPNLDSITPTNEAVITNAEKTNIDFGVDFDLPGDYYEFDVDIKNDGTIDAAINEVLTSGLSDEQKAYMTFEVKYQDGTELKRCDLLPAQDHVGVRVKVKYSEDITPEMLETIDGNANLHFEVEYIQAFDGCNNLPDVLINHKVIIDPNGGEYTGDLETTLKMGETVEIGTPTNEGYTFLGWEVSDPSKFNNNIVTMGSRDIRLVAKWEMTGEVIARINDPENGEEFPSIQAAIKKAQTDDVIYLVKSTVESPNNNKKVKLDLQGNTVTGQLTNTGDIVVVNGSIENISGSAVENTGTFTLGENDGEVSVDSVSLIGTDIGINQNGTFNFYDGFIEGIVGINGDYNDIPVDWYVFVDHNNEKDCQKVYLVETLTRAVAKTTEGGTVYYFNLQDAINTVALNPMDIYAIRDFEAAYTLTVQEGKSAVFDIAGYNVTTGYSITNNGTMTLRDSKEEKGILSPSLTIENNGILNIDDITITETTDNNVINNKNELHITNSTLTAKAGYAVNNTDNGSITLDESSTLTTNNIAINNTVEGANIVGGNIRGINSTKSVNISNSNITANYGKYAITLTGTTNNISNINVNSEGSCLQETSTTTTIKNSVMTCYQEALVLNSGEATLTGNEITSYYETIEIPYNKTGKITIESGTYKSTNGTTIYNNGAATVIINDGSILNTSSNSYYAIYNYRGLVTINGGYVEATNTTTLWNYSSVTINGGVIKSLSKSAIENSRSLTINGGEIIANENGVLNGRHAPNGWQYDYGNVVINGGTIKSNHTGINNQYNYNIVTINNDGAKEGKIYIQGDTQGIYQNDGTTIINTHHKEGIEDSPKIEGGSYGIYEKGGTINVGILDENIQTNAPILIGGYYGYYKNGGVINFYDGIFKGQTGAYNDTEINTVPDAHTINIDSETINEAEYVTAYLVPEVNFLRVGETEYNSFAKAVSAIETEGTIEMIADGITKVSNMIPEGKNITLDLAGYQLTTTKDITNKGTLKIIDSSEGKTGSLLSNDASDVLISSGNLTVEGIKLTKNNGSNNAIKITNGTLTITDTILNTSSNGITISNATNTNINNLNMNSTYSDSQGYCIQSVSSNMTVTNSAMNCSANGLILNSGEITLTSNEITSYYETIEIPYNQTVKITIESGTYKSTNGTTINNYGYGTITINDGNILNTLNRENAIYNYRGSITINGGYVEATNTITLWNYSSVTINGGVIKSLSKSAIENVYNLTINGGEIIANENGVLNDRFAPNGWQYSYGNVVINGGTIKSNQIGIYNQYDSNIVTFNNDATKENKIYIQGNTYGIYQNTGTTIINTHHKEGIEDSPKIEGGTYGIYEKLGTLTIGTLNDNILNNAPIIIGTTNGLYKEGGIFNFYDGILKGQTSAYVAEINTVPDAHTIKIDSEIINEINYETAYLIPEVNFLRVGDTEYNSFAKAVSAIETDGIIEVIANGITKVSNTIPDGKNITLDLAGYQLTTTKDITNNGTLKIIDSSEGKTGSLLSNDASDVLISSGNLTVEGIKLTKNNGSNNAIKITNGTLTITDTTLNTSSNGITISNATNTNINNLNMNSTYSNGQGYCIQSESSNMTVTNSAMNCSANGLILNSGEITLTSNEITSYYETIEIPYNKTGKITIESGIYKSTNGTTIYNDGYGTITINDGNILNTLNGGNAIYNYRGSITINGGYVEATNTITLWNYSSITINGGVIKSLSKSAIENSGSLTINGGEIIAEENGIINSRHAPNGWQYSYGGTNVTGGTIKGKVSGIYNQYDINTINIGQNDGILNSNNPTIIGESYGLYSDIGTVNFYDGILKGQVAPYYTVVNNIADNAMPVDLVETINGVEYQTEHLEEQEVFIKNGDKGYTNLQTAINEAQNTDTLVMVKDVSIFYPVAIETDKVITIDTDGKSMYFTKTITNNGNLTLTDTSDNADNYIKMTINLNIVDNNGVLNISNIDFNTRSSLKSNSGSTLNIDNVNYTSSDTALEIYGTLELTNSNVTGINYAVYFYDTSGDSIINSTELTANRYALYSNSSNLIDMDNSNLNGNLYINNNAQILNYNIGEINGTFTNNGEMNLEKVNITNIINDSHDSYRSFTNNGTFNMKNGVLSFTANNNIYDSLRVLQNNGSVELTTVDIIMDTNDNIGENFNVIRNEVGSHLIYNGGSISTTNGRNVYGIYNVSQYTETVSYNSNITMTGCTTCYGIYNNGSSNSINYSGNITLSGTNTYGIYSDAGKITLIDGTIDVSGTNAYGIYANNGEIAMGEYDGRGTSEVIVSQETPLVKAVGTTTGIGVKKVNGLFKFYDGKIVGSTNAKPETTTEVEYNFEATTHTDPETGYEYCVLEYLLDTVNEESA